MASVSCLMHFLSTLPKNAGGLMAENHRIQLLCDVVRVVCVGFDRRCCLQLAVVC